jgi:hypothetical protein
MMGGIEMDDTNFTPGPWHLGKSGDKCAKNHAICAGASVIAQVVGGGYPIGEGWSERTEANARLMAAAPKMADLLREILRWANDVNHPEGGSTSWFEDKILDIFDDIKGNSESGAA